MLIYRPYRSIRFILGLMIGVMGLLLVLQSCSGFYWANRQRRDAHRLAIASLGNAPLFASLTGERLTRGLVSSALVADAPVTDAAFSYMNENRRLVDKNYNDAMQQLGGLDLPGIEAVLADLRAAHDAALAVRPPADAAIHLPKAQRDPRIVHDEPLAIAQLQKAILAANAFLENAVHGIDPVVDHLLSLRRASREMRGAAGAVISRIQAALDAARPWNREDLAKAAADAVLVQVGWQPIVEATTLRDATPALIAAVDRVKAQYFGYVAGEQQAVMQQLRSGLLPQLSGADFKTHAASALLPIALVAEASMQGIVARTATIDSAALSGLIRNTVLLVAALSMTALGFLTAHYRISRPLHQLRRAMGDLAQAPSGRDVAAEFPGASRRDEIGGMARALSVFRAEMIRAEDLAVLTAEQRRAEEARAAALTAELEGMAERQGEVVETMVFGLMQLSEGNLAFALPVPLAPEYETLRTLFNDAVAGLRATIRDVLTRAEAIGNGTGEIAKAAEDLAQRTQLQASRLKQAAAALAELTATVRQTAAGSARARVLAATAKCEAAESGEVVRQTVAAMEQIEASARQIDQVITLIDDIAFQTNLLALNAGVEAARAGDSGRGFAVIASEVRALAQRAGLAAREITGLIQSSVQHVARGVRLVGKTGEALDRIQQSVVKIDVAINNIAASAQEQSSGLAEVNTTVNQMDAVTQQNAAMVEQTTAATVALAQETADLTRAVQHFIVEPAPAAAEAA